MQKTTLSRRTLIGSVAVGIGGFGSTNTVVGQGPPENLPNVEFPSGAAFVGPDNPGPMEGAVETENAYMPEGGWVIIQGNDDDKIGDEVIGQSMRKLPAGHFKKLRVAVKALDEGTYDLRATLFKGKDQPDEPYTEGVPFDDAEIGFP